MSGMFVMFTEVYMLYCLCLIKLRKDEGKGKMKKSRQNVPLLIHDFFGKDKLADTCKRKKKKKKKLPTNSF